MTVLLLILGIVMFIGLVVVHEWGHFIAARRNGVEVEEFGIGFPPKAWGKKVGKGDKKFIFSLNWLPLGGFVRLKGEHDSDTEPGTFGAATTWAKTKIMAAGVGMNLLAAFVLLTLVALVGMPQLIDNQFTIVSDTKVTKNETLVGYVLPGSPAEKAGLQVSDQLLSVGATQVTSAQDLPKITQDYAGQKVAVTYMRHGEQRTVQVALASKTEVEASNHKKAYLGVSPSSYTLQRSTWSAPVVAVGTMKQFTVLTFQGLGKAVSGVGSIIAGFFSGNSEARQAGQAAASEQVAGPVGIFAVLKNGSVLGYQFVLMVVAIISLSLAIMNVLPIPALDGGKVFVTFISRLFGKRVSETVEDYIYGTSFVFLLALMVLITVVDVKRFF